MVANNQWFRWMNWLYLAVFMVKLIDSAALTCSAARLSLSQWTNEHAEKTIVICTTSAWLNGFLPLAGHGH